MEKNEVKNKVKSFYKKHQNNINMIAAGLAGFGTVFVGYKCGYNRAKSISDGIVDCIDDELKGTEHEGHFYDIWNYGVAKYFGLLKEN